MGTHNQQNKEQAREIWFKFSRPAFRIIQKVLSYSPHIKSYYGFWGMTNAPTKTKKLVKSEVSIVLGDPSSYARAMIMEVLRNLGYQRIFSATNAAEIIEAANVWHPRVIILENLLPDMRGTELVGRIRKDLIVPDRSVPCIMITSDPSLETVQEARMAGVDEFAAKPVSHKAIEARLDEVLLRPRPFIEAKKYVGPCRRRKRTLSYKGTMKRLTDPLQPVKTDTAAEAVRHKEMLTQCTEVICKIATEIDPTNRAEVRHLFNTANEANEIAQRLRDEALEVATNCISLYIQGVGASGALQAFVLTTHVEALRLLLGSTDRDSNERLQIAHGLRTIVAQKLHEAV